jgi:hypothetical protein
MASIRGRVAVWGLAALLAGCATTPPPGVEVTRFHLGQPIPGDSIALVAGPGIDAKSLEFRSYAAAVATDLGGVGLRAADAAARTAYIALVKVEQTSRPGGPPKSSGLRIGIGGGTGGSGGGIGGGVSVPVGGTRSRDVRVNELSVQIKRRSDNSMVWEGRAVQEIAADAPASALPAAVPALSRAMFADFPGPSGQTIRVKTPK